MKRSSRNFLTGVLILTLVTVISMGCATKKGTTQPDTKPAPTEAKTEEPTKSVPAPSAKAQEATPAPSEKTPEVAPPPSSPTTTTTPPPPSKTVEASQPPAPRTTEIVFPFVNVRQGPSTDSKIIAVVKKGAKLTVLEDKLGWLRVRLEDGKEGWVGKNMTAEGTKASPAAPAKPKSP